MGRKKKERPFVVRQWSLGDCPTPQKVLSAWERRNDSQKDFIWLLSVLDELTCFTDSHLQHKGGFGNIAGRAGGLKAHLAREIPELAPQYKSVSRYAALAFRLRKAFNLYPPTPLSLLRRDIPRPKKINMPFFVNFAANVYARYFRRLPPTYTAFKAVVDRRMATPNAMDHPWGTTLPREDWPEAERKWRAKIIRPHALAAIFDITLGKKYRARHSESCAVNSPSENASIHRTKTRQFTERH